MNDNQRLRKDLERQVKRIKRAERERQTVLSQGAFLGTLGVVFVLPVVGGAYLGRWLDSMSEGYSARWTLSLLLLGVVVGVMNVYLLMKRR